MIAARRKGPHEKGFIFNMIHKKEKEWKSGGCVVAAVGLKRCIGTCRAATHTTMVILCIGMHATSKKVVPSIGTSVTLLSDLLFVISSLFPPESSWLVVAMLVLTLSPLTLGFSPLLNLTAIFFSYVRGYGQRWLWGHHEYWYFGCCDWYDDKKIWVHSSAKMYLINYIFLFISIIFHLLTK